MRISDWSSDVCSSDLQPEWEPHESPGHRRRRLHRLGGHPPSHPRSRGGGVERRQARSEEHTSELQSLMRISYPVFCLKNKLCEKKHHTIQSIIHDLCPLCVSNTTNHHESTERN